MFWRSKSDRGYTQQQDISEIRDEIRRVKHRLGVGDDELGFVAVRPVQEQIDEIHQRLAAMEDYLGVERKYHENDTYYEEVDDSEE